MENGVVEGKPWLEIGCCESCWFAREVKCVCRCRGAFHGSGSMLKLDQVLEQGVSARKLEDPISIEKNFRPSEI